MVCHVMILKDGNKMITKKALEVKEIIENENENENAEEEKLEKEENKPEKILVDPTTQAFFASVFSSFFNQLDADIRSGRWDRNENGMTEGSEVIKGILSSPRLIAMFFSCIAGLYSIIKMIRGFVIKDIDWISVLYGLCFVICGIVIYIILRNNGNSSIANITRLNREHKAFVKQIVDEGNDHYNTLKERFISYKNLAETKFEKAQMALDSWKEQYWQIMSNNNYRGDVIKLIQEDPRFKGINILGTSIPKNSEKII